MIRDRHMTMNDDTILTSLTPGDLLRYHQPYPCLTMLTRFSDLSKQTTVITNFTTIYPRDTVMFLGLGAKFDNFDSYAKVLYGEKIYYILAAKLSSDFTVL